MFKPIRRYKERYMIDEYGKILSLVCSKPKFLKPCKNDAGYIETVLVDKNGKRKNEKWHRLVAETFIQNLHKKPCINHKNGIKTDNRASNLEWCTEKENSVHARDMLKIKYSHKKGIIPKELRHRLKLSPDKVNKIIKRLNNGEMGKYIAKDYGVSDQAIYDIKNRRCWLKK